MDIGRQLERIGGFICHLQTVLFTAYRQHKGFYKPGDHQRKPERHDHRDMPLHDVKLVEILGAKPGTHLLELHARAVAHDDTPVYFQRIFVPAEACALAF